MEREIGYNKSSYMVYCKQYKYVSYYIVDNKMYTSFIF